MTWRLIVCAAFIGALIGPVLVVVPHDHLDMPFICAMGIIAGMVGWIATGRNP